ncbi:AAA family ATPase [Patescibacteria group bacterium]
MSDAERQNLIRCGRCDGTGTEHGGDCEVCRGIGVGHTHGPLFLYWGPRVDSFAVALDRTRKITNFVINLLLLLAFLGGLVLLGLRIAAAQQEAQLTMSLWHEPHPWLLGFWVGTVCFGLLHYRRSLAAKSRRAVRLQSYGEDLPPMQLPDDPEIWVAARKLPRGRSIDVAAAYSLTAHKAVLRAFRLARKLQHREIRPIHLFGALLSSPEVSVMMYRLGLKFDNLQEDYFRILAESAPDEHSTHLSPPAAGALIDAYVEAYKHRQSKVDPTDMLIAAVAADDDIQEMLFGLDVDVQKLENVADWNRADERMRERRKQFSTLAALKPKGTMNRAMTAVATPYLDTLSADLTMAAKYGRLAPVVAREREFEGVFRAIEGGGKSVVLVGHPGVGKNAIIEGIAQRMVEENVPAILQDKRLVSLALPQLVSGATPAEAQERLLRALFEIGRAGNIALVVNDVGGMVGITAGSGESVDLSKVFAEELSRGYFFCICTATPEDYVSAIERSALGQALVKVEVGEPDVDEAIHVLESKVGGIEYRNRVYFSYGGVEAAVKMSDRYMHEKWLPEKAIEVAREAAQATAKSKGPKSVVLKEDVAAVVSEKTNIPLTALTEEQSQKLLKLEEHLHARVIGQEQAVSAVSSAMRRAGAELRSTDRPIANFLFLGPTGVGKTELAKALAESHFGDENAMIRVDMSEYQDKSAIHKMIGEPGGQSGGVLTEAVRKKPFALVLLDELEKAHPDILTLFLQVMDDGRLSDNTGRTIDFTNVILIATSNAGAHFIQDEIKKGAPTERIKEGLLGEHLKDSFRPEFINRFDDVVVFTPIQPDELLQITRLMLRKVEQRLEDKGIHFEITDEAVKELAREGYDPLYGARPLRRVIQDRVDSKIADALLAGDIGRKDKVVYDTGGTIRVEKG